MNLEPQKHRGHRENEVRRFSAGGPAKISEQKRDVLCATNRRFLFGPRKLSNWKKLISHRWTLMNTDTAKRYLKGICVDLCPSGAPRSRIALVNWKEFIM